MQVERFIDQYLENYTNYKEFWNYEDGCVLLGCKNLFEATGEKKYYDFIERYLDGFVTEDGRLLKYDKEKYNIDNINSGKILFFMYERTGEEKYRGAIEVLMDQLRSHPRCSTGNFFHKKIYPDQIWLDGLYMAQPFYMEYETKFENKEHYGDIVAQFRNVQKYLFDEEKGLCYHACDIEKKAFWADPETGRSANFWLRSMGWYLMALVDTMYAMNREIYEQYRELEDIFKTVLKGILRYQDPETGLFYQVIDRSDVEGNYLETSGTAMIAYAILKACRMGILLKEKYAGIGERIVESLIENKLIEKDGKYELTGICSVAGLGPETNRVRDGSVEYYLSEPVVSNDAKGVGPFFMAYGQYLSLHRENA
ncbi:MAG: glycoside hydrolase family 88 protein [Lachnospiraceae bacterium]|nr:glycoside hydrolase family 88 protein [Lachnospiraceae bacterium]